MQKVEKNIVILISGTGTNMAAVVQASQKEQWRDNFGASIACVISNRPDATGLAFAQSLGVATQVLDHTTFASRKDFDAALADAIDHYRPALVLLAGFMRILTPGFIGHYAGRLLNIHPSLLPAFAGLNTQQRAIDAGCTVAGATVHWVTAELDDGHILAQAAVPVLPNDTAELLAARTLTQEHKLYPLAVRKLLQSWTPKPAARDVAPGA